MNISKEHEANNFLKQDRVLTLMVHKIVTLFQPKKIFLFGSRARRQNLHESDYDLFVILPVLSDRGYHYAQRAHIALWGIGQSKDIVFQSLDRFERRKHFVGSLDEIVGREGIEVYAARDD